MKKLIALIKSWFAFECEREAMGYNCHAGNPNYPEGCESCGRGAIK